MARYLKQSTNVHVIVGPFVDETDGVTPITSVTLGDITAGRIIGVTNTAITLAASGNNQFTHVVNGMWELDLTATDTGTLGHLRIHFTDIDSFLPVWADFTVLPANVYDALVADTDKLDASVVEWLGTAVTAATAGRPDVNMAAISDGTTEADSLQAAVNTADNLVDCNMVQISDSSSAADALETLGVNIVSGWIAANVRAINGSSENAERFDQLMDGATRHIVDDGGFTPTTTAFEIGAATSPSAVDDFYNGQFVRWSSGALAGQVVEVTDYDGTNKRFTVSTMTSAPAGGDTFIFQA
jgi:hypothetical protein